MRSLPPARARHEVNQSISVVSVDKICVRAQLVLEVSSRAEEPVLECYMGLQPNVTYFCTSML